MRESMKVNRKSAFSLLCMLGIATLVAAGCSSGSGNQSDKSLAAGHALPPAMEAEMRADVAKQEAEEAAGMARANATPMPGPPKQPAPGQ
jgi:hypothetical protein